MTDRLYSVTYYPVGDLIVVSICIVMLVLMFFSYNRKSRSFRIFLGIIGLLILAADSNVTFNMLALTGNVAYEGAVNAIRCLYHASLFGIFLLYVRYIIEVTRLERDRARVYQILSMVLYVVIVGLDVASILRSHSALISENGFEIQGRHFFFIGYIAYVALIAVLMANIRGRLYRKVMLGFYGTMAISFLMLMLQGLAGQTSFTVATFLYPVIAMFYILHSNPYDARSGAMDASTMDDMVRYNYKKGINFMFMSLYMPDFDHGNMTIPDDVQATVRHFTVSYFKGSMLFRIGPGHLVLIFSKRKNPDYEASIDRILRDFRLQYSHFQYDYKIVIGESIPEISRDDAYSSFIRDIHRGMELNSIHWVVPDDVTRFRRFEILQEALADISARRDLNDPRVLAYCQPVYNIQTRSYDTAEALMRLNIPELGMVPPNRFIALAEENGQIHALTMIILHKTCEAVRRMLEDGYAVSRISVNVSAIELKDEGFCRDVVDIIEKSGIPGEKIAIELTESRTDSDFDHMKHMIEALRHHGIKFYLDDFGTGYSNMERIMELPFDIIKFDRSMVLASEASARSRTIVYSLANMFNGLNYSVLYEGVEKESEERMCIDMSASYLQGFKYSRPVPIENLEDYFTRVGAA